MTPRFTEDTEVEVTEHAVEDVHLEDLSFVLDFDVADDGTVTHCSLDVSELIRAVTLLSSADSFQYGWRRADVADDPTE